MIQDIYPHQFHIEYHDLRCTPDDILLCYGRGTVIAAAEGDGDLRLPTVGEAADIIGDSEPRYLFSVDETRFFGVPYAKGVPFGGYGEMILRELRHIEPRHLAFAAAVGSQICSWYAKNRFCGCCGGAMEHSDTERALRCPDCGNLLYPVIAPSVIVALYDGDRLLLTRYQSTHSVYRHRALVAGYIETGETAEDAVRREVMEEVGLRVKNIRYYKSQPWVFSGALLLGFFCELDGSGDISCDESELSEAEWTPRGELPDRSSDTSLTSEMIEIFRHGKEI